MHVNTADMHPIIGQHPQHEDVWLSFGFSGHGFKFSNVVGELMADLVEKGSDTTYHAILYTSIDLLGNIARAIPPSAPTKLVKVSNELALVGS